LISLTISASLTDHFPKRVHNHVHKIQYTRRSWSGSHGANRGNGSAQP
jgi:hypothetical protein